MALVLDRQGEVVEGNSHPWMVRAQNFFPNHQRFAEQLDRLVIRALDAQVVAEIVEAWRRR